MAENLLLHYAMNRTYNNDAENVVGASVLIQREVTDHTDANSIYVRKFGTQYEITDVTDISDPVDVNMTYKIYALDGTLLGSRVGGGAFDGESGPVTAQGCYLDIIASGGAVTVPANVTLDTVEDPGGLLVILTGEVIPDGTTIRFYIAYSGSTYYDSELMYGGGRHTPNSTSRYPYFDITTAIADPDVTGFTITTVLDSAVYDEQFAISIAGMILQADDGQTPKITSGVGARVTREVEHDGNNSDTRYVSKTGNDGNPGTYQSPYLTIQFAENNMGGKAYLNIMDSGIYIEVLIINIAITVEPLYGMTPTIKYNTGTFVIRLTLNGIVLAGFNIDGDYANSNLLRLVSVNPDILDCSFYNGVSSIFNSNIYLDQFDGRFLRNHVYNNSASYTIFLDAIPAGEIAYNIIHNNTGVGIYSYGRIDHINDNIHNNIIYNCLKGIYINTLATNFNGIIENNICYNNVVYGLEVNITVLTGVIRDMICWGNGTFDLYKPGPGGAVTITESNYGTNSGFTIGAGNITTDPEFCKTTTPYKLGISANSGAYRTDTSDDDMGAHFRIIEINESNIEINGFKIDGQEQYNNGIFIKDNVDHTGTKIKWCDIYDFQGIAIDLFGDGTDTDAEIKNNKIYYNGNGIKFNFGRNIVEENLIYGNTIYGIHADYTGQIFNHNVFHNNQYGIYLESNSNAIIKNCIFAENSIKGIDSEVNISITYCCYTDGMSSTVDTSHTSNFTNNPLFINTNAGEENFNLKTVEQGYTTNSPCKDSSDTTAFPDIGAYDILRSLADYSWKRYPFAFNPQVSWNNNAKGYSRFENAAGDEDNFAKSHKRRFTFDFGKRGQVSTEEIRQKMEYFATLIKTKENEITQDEKVKFRLHFQPDSYLETGTLATISGTTIIDAAKEWIENQWKGFWAGIRWEHGTNMVIDPILKTGTVGGAAWTPDEWIGYYSYIDGYYYYIVSNTAAALTFSDPDETLAAGLVNWNIEKYFRIASNSVNVLCVLDPDDELPTGEYDYYIDFIEVKAFTPKFQYSQKMFLYDREHSKTGYKIIFEET